MIWGFIHGLGLIWAHLVNEFRSARAAVRTAAGLPPAKLGFWGMGWIVLSWAATFAYVNVAWVFFGAEDAGKAMADRLTRHLAPGGRLVLSGILTTQAAGVAAAYQATGLPEPAVRESGEWASLVWQ